MNEPLRLDLRAVPPLCFGARVSKPFRDRVRSGSLSLGMSPNHLMACMAFESGLTFSPSIRNAAGSGAVGLIQFMPQTAVALGTTTEALAEMTALGQLEYVFDYFRNMSNRLQTLNDVYMAILWPSAVGKPDSDVIFWRRDVLMKWHQYAVTMGPYSNDMPPQLHNLNEAQWTRLLSAPSARYVQNAGLDYNKDGMITKAEACARVNKLLAEGLKEGNAA